MPKKKLSDDDALALVLSGLKGELPVSDLCRKYGVSTATYYKLRDQFIAGGVQGLQNNGKTGQVKALELRIKELEQALGRKTLEVEVLKKQKISSTAGIASRFGHFAALAAELRKDGISTKDAAEILGVSHSRFYPRYRKSIKLLNLSRAMYLIKNCPQQLKWPVIAILFMAIAVFALYSGANLT